MNTLDQFPQVKALPVEQKLDLVRDLWDSISSEVAELPLSDEIKQLLDERLADIEANPDDNVTWEECLKNVRGTGQ